MKMKTLIRGGRVMDPANRVDAALNVLIDGGRIAWVGCGEPEADRVVCAEGRIVAPGFIDMHMHEDPIGPDGKIEYSIFENMLRMGVTTAIGGNCGINVYHPAKYLDVVDRDGAPVNVGMLAGHEYFRNAAGAMDKYACATEAQKQTMIGEIARALEDGCLGLSFGLRYVPGTDADELLRTAQCCIPQKKLIAAHVRDDADGVFGAVDEVMQLGEACGVPVQISHIGSMGGFGQMEEVLRRVDACRMRGLDVGLDCYPYFAFSTEIGATTYDDGWLERYRCDYDVLEFCEGKYKGLRATKERFEEMRRDDPDCITVCYVMKPDDVVRALRHPAVIVASDGILDRGQGHPRAAGTFPRFLAEFARKGAMDLYTAVEKMTAMPADRLHLANKGRLNVGADADVVVFDFAKIRDQATFREPMLPPEGIDCVLVGGKVAAKDGCILNGRCGRAVRG